MPPQRRMVKKRAGVQGKEAFKDSQERLNGCCWFKFSKLLLHQSGRWSLKAMEQCIEAQWYLCVFWLFGFMGFILHTPLASPEPLRRPNTWSGIVPSPFNGLRWELLLSDSRDTVGACWGVGDRLRGWAKGSIRRSETGVPAGQSRAITELVAPQPLPEGSKTTVSAEDAEGGPCSFSWVYMIALSQGYLNVKFLCRS